MGREACTERGQAMTARRRDDMRRLVDHTTEQVRTGDMSPNVAAQKLHEQGVPVAVIGRVLSAAVVEKSTRLNNEATAELIAIDQRAKPAIAPPSRNGTNP
jgi:hypothetical protein